MRHRTEALVMGLLLASVHDAAARSLLFELHEADVDYARAPSISPVAPPGAGARPALVLRPPASARFRRIGIGTGSRLSFATGNARPWSSGVVELRVTLRVPGERTPLLSAVIGPASAGWSSVEIDLGCAAGTTAELSFEAALLAGSDAAIALSGLDIDDAAGPPGASVLVDDLSLGAALPERSAESTTLTFTPPENTELLVDVQRTPGREEGSLQLQVALDRKLETFTLASPDAGARRHLDLAPFANRPVRLTARIAGSSTAAALAWRHLRVVRRVPADSLPGPDLLFLVVDTLRADRVGAYGHDSPTTPHLDRLSRSGRTFERVAAQAPWTLPSVASLMSGLYPRDAAGRDGSGQRAAPRVLAEAFASSGRATVAISANPMVDTRGGFDRGFASFATVSSASAGEIHGLFDQWLRDHPGGASFAYLHYLEPHEPYEPPRPFRGLVPLPRLGHETDPIRMSPAYDAEIASWDAELGILLARRRARGTGPPGLVAVTGDHGEELGEHGLLGHGKQLFEESLHVPLVLCGPGVVAGSLERVPMELRAASGLLAHALRVAWSGEEADRVISELSQQSGGGPGPSRAISDGRYKYVAVAGAPGRLFDLEQDPAERRDVASSHPALVEELARRLDAVLPVPLEPLPPPGLPDRELMEQLKALGYVP